MLEYKKLIFPWKDRKGGEHRHSGKGEHRCWERRIRGKPTAQMGEGTGREGEPERRGQPGRGTELSHNQCNSKFSEFCDSGGWFCLLFWEELWSRLHYLQPLLASVVNFALFGVLSYLPSGIPQAQEAVDFSLDRNQVKTCCFPASSCITGTFQKRAFRIMTWLIGPTIDDFPQESQPWFCSPSLQRFKRPVV